MTCLVQRNIEDLAEVDRIGRPELVGTSQFGDRDSVFQCNAGESVVLRDLRMRGERRHQEQRRAQEMRCHTS